MTPNSTSTTKPHVTASTHVADMRGGGMRWAMGIGGAILVIVVITIFAMKSSSATIEPRLNDSTPVLAKFVMTKEFETMPFEKRRLYYKVLDDRGKEIDDA